MGTDLKKAREMNALAEIVVNEITSRAGLLNRLIDPKRDINKECGYPDQLSIEDYGTLYDREGIATRVVDLYPEECWQMDPEIAETEDSEETEFEAAVKDLVKRKNLWHYCERLDKLSGVGRFGAMLIGVSGDEDLKDPLIEAEQVPETRPQERELLYLMPFDERNIEVHKWDTETSSERYGKPLEYDFKMADFSGGVEGAGQTISVHWSRVLHAADMRRSSEVFGTPRMQFLFNRMWDLRKLLGGSGEMFWKGAFPGYNFELDPEYADDAEIDKDALRKEFESFSNSLQRYMATKGLKAHSLAPQVADPSNHFEMFIIAVCIALTCPKRVFMGSEEAQLAMGEEMKRWNGRVMRRQNRYLTPFLVRELLDRLMMIGVLPVSQEYDVNWPDLNAQSDEDKATVAEKFTNAIAKYVAAGADSFIPPIEMLTMFFGLSMEEAEAIEKAAEKRIAEKEEEQRKMEEEMRAQGIDPTTGLPIEEDDEGEDEDLDEE